VAVEQHQHGRQRERQQHETSAAGASRNPSRQARHAGKLTAHRATHATIRPIAMFDANYFRNSLQRDVEAAGGSPIVELLLVGGHTHRVRAVLDVQESRVTFEAYHMKGDLTHQRPRFGQGSAAAHETFRVVVSCESIVAVVLDPAPAPARSRTGFA
jgi:hypothetical protein